MDNNKENLGEEEKVAEMETTVETLNEVKAEEVHTNKFFKCIKVILSGIIDQIIAVAIALIIFGLFKLILKPLGYEVVSGQEVFLIVYIISNVLFYPLSQQLLNGKTLGEKIMF